MFEKYITEIILTIIWAILAFVIQPHYLMRRISAKYRNKKWVEINLKTAHEQIFSGFSEVLKGSQVDFAEMIGEIIGETFVEERGNIISGVLGGFTGPLMKQAKAANGEVEQEIEGYLERTGIEESIAAAAVKEKYMEKIYEKYPLLAFAPDILGFRPGKGAHEGGGNDVRIGPRRDF